MSSPARASSVVGLEPEARSEMLAALETETWELPSWVLSSSRAVLAAVSFSKVTVADWGDEESRRRRPQRRGRLFCRWEVG